MEHILYSLLIIKGKIYIISFKTYCNMISHVSELSCYECLSVKLTNRDYTYTYDLSITKRIVSRYLDTHDSFLDL
jgi:hypothetical protein